MLIKKMVAIAILMLNLGINSSLAVIVDVTRTSILSEDTNANDPIKLRQALAQMLAKNTGEDLESIIQNPIFLQANLNTAIKRSYFEKIESQYLSENSPYHYWFHIVVSERYLKRMIAEAGFSLLPANRNQIMLWMVQEDDTKDDSMLSTIDKTPLLQYVESDLVLNYWLNHWADALGVVVSYPQLDIEDRAQVPKEAIKTLSFQAVDQSVNRYAVHQILMLYIKKSTDFLRLRSGFISNDDDIIIKHYQEPVVDIGSLLYSLMADVAQSHFQKSRIQSSDLLQHNVRIVINDLKNYNQVMNIQKYLSGLSVIDAYEIQSASDGQLVINVDLLIKTTIFLQVIERDKRLSYQQDSPINQLYFKVLN